MQKKIDRDRTSGSGDIVLESQKIIEILQFLNKSFFYFRRKSEFRPQKTNNYDLKCVTFYPETEYDSGCFSPLVVLARYPLLYNLAIL